jgi:DNA-binding GntR family transcriptional regulator
VTWIEYSYTIRRVSTVDLIERYVIDELMSGAHAPGAWLRQDELASRLGTSKIPVREALQRLEAKGLLVFEANRGARVPWLSVDDALENATLRRAVELELLRAAMPVLTVVDLAHAELALDERSVETTANWHFHRALYAASGWSRGIAIAELLHAAMAPYVLLYLRSLGGGAPSDAEHRALLDACSRRDVELAIELLARHLDNATRSVIDFLRCEPMPT